MVTYFAVATKSHLGHARALASRLRELSLDAEFLLFLADEPDGYFDPLQEPFRCIRLEEYVPVEDRARLTFGYTRSELANALKAFGHLYIQNQTTAPFWIYLDTDVLVVSLPKPFDEAGRKHAVVITPHLTQLRADEPPLCERIFLDLGIFNGGFVAIRRCEQSEMFVRWFVFRLREQCFYDPPHLFVDQLWLNLLAGVEFVFIWRHPGANVGYWNLHERNIDVGERAGAWQVNGRELLFLHFSNWDEARPDIVSRSGGEQKAPENWRVLAEQYGRRLLQSGVEECASWPYTFASFTDHRPVESYHRKRWLNLPPVEKAFLGDPLDASHFFYKHAFYERVSRRLRFRLRSALTES